MLKPINTLILQRCLIIRKEDNVKMTNNGFHMHVNGNASPSQTSTNSTLTTNGVSCDAIYGTGSGARPTTPSVAGVLIGMDTSAAGGIEVCASNTQYIDFTIIILRLQNEG